MKHLKRAWIVCVVVVLTLALAACGCNHEEVIDSGTPATCTAAGMTEGKHCALCEKVLVQQAEIPATGHIEEVVPAVEATCTTAGSTEGKKCSACGEVLVAAENVAALGHTTTSGTCTRCNKSMGSFSIDYYVDEFNQPTKDGYVYNPSYFLGTFSNSATTDSTLTVQMLVDKEDIAFFLYEYGKYQVKNSSSYSVDKYNITMKTADGTKHSLKGTVYCGGDRLFIDSKYKSKVIEALKSGETVSFYIEEKDRATTQYLFAVSSSNFADKYTQLLG